MTLKVLNASDAQLIAELVLRHGHMKAPTKSTNDGSFREVVVADGKDHTFRILIEGGGPLLSMLPRGSK